jgi:hypothetical protein
MLATVLLASLAATQPAAAEGLDPQLAPPVRIEAAGKPIDTEIGHAAPFVGDFDGDGIRDLLVGQFGGGKLWIFHNDAKDGTPKLRAGQVYKDGAQTGVVPAG